MCRPASFIVTKSMVLWSRKSESHEDIINENHLSDRKIKPDFVRVEIVPKNYDYMSPLDQWQFRVDQDVTPEWWDPREGEIAVRNEIANWAEVKIVKGGEHRHESGLRFYLDSKVKVYGGQARFFGTSMGEVRGGEARFFKTSRGEVHGGEACFYGTSRGEVHGGEAWFHDSSQGEVHGGKVWFYDTSKGEVHGGEARFYDFSNKVD